MTSVTVIIMTIGVVLAIGLVSINGDTDFTASDYGEGLLSRNKRDIAADYADCLAEDEITGPQIAGIVLGSVAILMNCVVITLMCGIHVCKWKCFYPNTVRPL